MYSIQRVTCPGVKPDFGNDQLSGLCKVMHVLRDCIMTLYLL
jgi:hypothetical protein